MPCHAMPTSLMEHNFSLYVLYCLAAFWQDFSNRRLLSYMVLCTLRSASISPDEVWTEFKQRWTKPSKTQLEAHSRGGSVRGRAGLQAFGWASSPNPPRLKPKAHGLRPFVGFGLAGLKPNPAFGWSTSAGGFKPTSPQAQPRLKPNQGSSPTKDQAQSPRLELGLELGLSLNP